MVRYFITCLFYWHFGYGFTAIRKYKLLKRIYYIYHSICTAYQQFYRITPFSSIHPAIKTTPFAVKTRVPIRFRARWKAALALLLTLPLPVCIAEHDIPRSIVFISECYRYPEFDTTQRWVKVPSQELSDSIVKNLKDKK